MNTVELNSEEEPKFGPRKPNERIYWDYARILENASRPLNGDDKIKAEKYERINRLILRTVFCISAAAGTLFLAWHLIPGENISAAKVFIYEGIVFLYASFWFFKLE